MKCRFAVLVGAQSLNLGVLFCCHTGAMDVVLVLQIVSKARDYRLSVHYLKRVQRIPAGVVGVLSNARQLIRLREETHYQDYLEHEIVWLERRPILRNSLKDRSPGTEWQSRKHIGHGNGTTVAAVI